VDYRDNNRGASTCRFFSKNSLTDISFCDFAMSSAEDRRLRDSGMG
jgi:hypothetical protein